MARPGDAFPKCLRLTPPQTARPTRDVGHHSARGTLLGGVCAQDAGHSIVEFAAPRGRTQLDSRLGQRHGQLEKSQRDAERGYAQNQTSNPEWARKFQLLKAEILLRRGMSDDALQLLHADRPSSDSPQDAIRMLTIQAVAFAHQEQLDLADQTITQAERLCKNADSVACGEVLQARGAIAMSEDKLADARLDFLGALAIARSFHAPSARPALSNFARI